MIQRKYDAILLDLAGTLLTRGEEVHPANLEATCGNCHRTQPGDRYTAKDWEAIGMHMTITARLTDAQAAAVLEFLKSSAMKPEGGANGTASRASQPQARQPAPAVPTPEQVAAARKYIRELKVRR